MQCRYSCITLKVEVQTKKRKRILGGECYDTIVIRKKGSDQKSKIEMMKYLVILNKEAQENSLTVCRVIH